MPENVGYLDQTLSMRQHIDSVCRASFQELRWVATIRPYLSQSATARLVAAMIISRLDYCNSVFAGLQADQVARLQRIQNNAARLVMKKRKRDHVTLLLNFTGYLWNFAASIRSRVWPIAISKGLYLRIFFHLFAPMNHPGLCDLTKKNYSKSPSETRNLLGNILLVSWRRLFGTHYQPI